MLINQKGLPSRSVKRALLLYENLCLLSAYGKSSQLKDVTVEKVNVLVVTDISYSDQNVADGERRFACACSYIFQLR